MKPLDRERTQQLLTHFSERAQALADELDPERKRTHKDEVTRSMISVLDQVAAASSRGLSILRVTKED